MSGVCVRFFASLRDKVGMEEMSLPLAEPLGLDGILHLLESRLPAQAFAALAGESVRIALNQELIHGPCEVAPGDELAFLPPMTGG